MMSLDFRASRPARPGVWREASGAWWFGLHCPGATEVELCFFSQPQGQAEIQRSSMHDVDEGWWQLRLEALPGEFYGYRVHGPWQPEQGLRFNPHKLLLDPYALLVVGPTQAHPSMWRGQGPEDPRWGSDSAPHAPKARVEIMEWPCADGPHQRPHHPWSETVIQELHVRGFSQRHPALPPELRGRYLGLCHPELIAHWKALGVTTLQLLPVQQHLDDRFLVEQGLCNFWGYNTLAYFAPHGALARDPSHANEEFREMVRRLHEAGIEVILDVVYNHCCETLQEGPVLSLRGLHEQRWFRRDGAGSDLDCTGCGHSLDSASPAGLQLILDSLRHWAAVMGVDGFRLDLAVTVGRNERHEFDPCGAFFAAVGQDPILRQLKWIAEPWDVGAADSYQLGRFPAPWRELNGSFRDVLRRFWCGESGVAAEAAKRLCGSQDLFSQRGPLSSVNLITSHDGFTLRDWACFEQRHNEQNGEGNRDGEMQNHSCNWGVEGLQACSEIQQLRRQVCRAISASLMTSVGVPLICAGDEIGRTQQGNNNAYCQDNELSWLDWANTDLGMLEFWRHLGQLRQGGFGLQRRGFFSGQAEDGEPLPDIEWFNLEAGQLDHAGWHDPLCKGFIALRRDPAPTLWIVNASGLEREVPTAAFSQFLHSPPLGWQCLLDSSLEIQPNLANAELLVATEGLRIAARGVSLWRAVASG